MADLLDLSAGLPSGVISGLIAIGVFEAVRSALERRRRRKKPLRAIFAHPKYDFHIPGGGP